MSKISRREALGATGGAAVVVLASGGLAVAAADSRNILVGSDHPDAELFALDAEYQRAKAAFGQVLDELSEAENRAHAKYPPMPVLPEQPDLDWSLSLKDLFGESDSERRIASRATQAERDRIQSEHEHAKALIDTECGLDAAHEAEDQSGDVVIAVVKRMMETPARTIEGLRVKFRVFAEDWIDQEEFAEPFLEELEAIAA